MILCDPIALLLISSLDILTRYLLNTFAIKEVAPIMVLSL